MVVMFVGLLWWGRRTFPYYSYCRNPTGREFFVPTRTLIGVFLLTGALFHDEIKETTGFGMSDW